VVSATRVRDRADFCDRGWGFFVPATSSYTPTSYSLLYGILYGTKWATTSLTFSFPSSAAVYGTPYGNGETSNNFEAFNATQQSATRAILEMYSSVAKLKFTEVTETSSVHADLRYGESDSPVTAWAYYPTTNILGGDIWVNNSRGAYDNPIAGNYGFFTLMHETGHALGLKHPHDIKGAFTQGPLDHDSIEYTVMSYKSYVGASLSGYTNGTTSYPQTLMMYDIAALQYLYGANYNTNAGNTTYQWSTSTGQISINGAAQGMPAGNKIFMTIWDGGGDDT
jgi:serralysin